MGPGARAARGLRPPTTPPPSMHEMFRELEERLKRTRRVMWWLVFLAIVNVLQLLVERVGN